MLGTFPVSLVFCYPNSFLCSPGRFFAINLIKAVLSYLILNYDIRLPDGSDAPPPPRWVAGLRYPGPGAKVMLKKRKSD